MSITRWLSRANARLRSKKRAPRRPINPLSGIHDWVLEDRCLLSGVGPDPQVPTGSNKPLSMIFWNGGAPLDTSSPFTGITAAPTLKTITLTNTTDQTIYPILRDANNGKDPHNTNTKNANNYYDPQDLHNQEFRAYIGYVDANGVQRIGLPAHASITIRVPLVFWDAENTYIATDGKDLFPTDVATQSNPFQYAPGTSSDRGVSLSTDANSWVTQFTSTDSKVTTGLVMFYHSTVPLTPALDSPAQLTEFTIRDPYLNTGGMGTDQGWLIDPAQTKVLFNYDVSYVDNLTAPITMEATQVPIPIANNPTPPAADYGWVGSNLLYGSPQQAGSMQQLISDFINNKGEASIGQYFGGQGWPSYINPDGILKIPGGANIFANSPLNAQRSSYFTYGPNNQWMLSSGGTAPIQEGAGGAILTDPHATVLPLLFTSDTQRATFFANLQQMLANNQEVDFQISGATLSPVLGKVVSYNNDRTTATVTVTLNQGVSLPTNVGLSYVFSRPPSDYAATEMMNLWYSWANYYITQFTNFVPPTGVTGNIADKTNVLTLDNPVPSSLAVGMTVSGPGINPAPGTTVTILGFNPDNVNQIYLSQLSTGGGSGTYTFGAPQALPFANSDGVKSLFVTDNGSGYTSPPTVTITGGGGTGATAVAVIDDKSGKVTNVVLTNAGSGYTSAPTIAITGGGGSGATATATLGTYVKPIFTTLTQDPNEPNLKAFAGSVYEAMAAESTISAYTAKSPNLPAPMSLVYTTIGCDTQDLPNSNAGGSLVGAEVRDLIKSILRGVPNFKQVPESQWYPNPGTPTAGQKFNVYNLDPYVWFVHDVLNMSGYGFSVDDDTADVDASASNYTPVDQQVQPNNLQFVFSGLGNLKNTLQWFGSVKWGTVKTQGTVSNPTSGPYAGKTIVTLTNAQQYWQISNPNLTAGETGAYVSGQGIPNGTVVQAQGDSNQLILILNTGKATATPSNGPIDLTFTGKPLTAEATNPPPTSPAPPLNNPPPTGSPPMSGHTLTPFQQAIQLAEDEFLMTIEQIVAFVESSFGIVPDSTLENSIQNHMNDINSNPFAQTLVGQELIDATFIETLKLITLTPIIFAPGPLP